MSGDPEGDLLAPVGPALDAGDEAFEYRLWFNMDAALERTLKEEEVAEDDDEDAGPF